MIILLNEQKELYDPPYNEEEIIKNYGKESANKLMKDPVHGWRIKTGIELIHKEPSIEELHRTMKNWKLMTKEQKRISDQMSIKLFGVDNITHYKQLVKEY